MEDKTFMNVFVNALIHSVLSILSFIILLPFNIWKKSLVTLDAQRENGSLKMGNISGCWPFLSYLKKFLIDFFFDAVIALSYVIGVLMALGALFNSGFLAFLLTLLGVYFFPINVAILRDLFQIMLIPFRKFLSWGSKPAQHLDLEVKNK